MHAVEFEGSIYIGKPKEMTDEECYGIHARPMTSADHESIKVPFWRIMWQPSVEDIAAINRGQPIGVDITSAFRDPATGTLKVGPLMPHVIFTWDEQGNTNQD